MSARLDKAQEKTILIDTYSKDKRNKCMTETKLVSSIFVSLSLSLAVCLSLSIPCRNLGAPYLDEAKAATRAALPFPTSVCSIFACPKNSMGASVWDL